MDRRYKLILIFIITMFIGTNVSDAYVYYSSKNIKSDYMFAKPENINKKAYVKIFVKEEDKDKNKINIEKTNYTKEDVSSKESGVKKEVLSLNDEQLYLLSKLVAAEARGESYQGQVAVAAVVINRVKDSRFPDSIEGVIYQKNAFSVVKNGYIEVQPTEESYKAAKEALYGNDPTSNAIYFWNPDISTCRWINNLDPYLRIGSHVFAK